MMPMTPLLMKLTRFMITVDIKQRSVIYLFIYLFIYLLFLHVEKPFKLYYFLLLLLF